MIGILLMEEHLNYNWNVYKIFKNGNRAQAPFMTFEHCESDAEEYFEEEVKKNFTKKLQQTQFMIMRADKPQTTLDDPRKKYLLSQKRVIQKHLSDNLKKIQNLSWGLVLMKESHWKWQWAALESATNNYVAAISPLFKDQKGAHEWMEQQISYIEDTD